MEFGVHCVDTHMRKTNLTTVYTDDPGMMKDSINTMGRLLATDDKYKVVSFGLTYISGCLSTTPTNPKVPTTLGLASQKLVDIHDHYKVCGSKKDKDFHVDLAMAIIDPYYRDMNGECDKNKLVWHKAWVKILNEYHLQTVTKEEYTCYEMFRQIVDMRKCLLPEDNEGLSHKQSGGGNITESR
ncbi:hypothetical protein D1007_14876 [Hordeum vulgare]|nr:hypothetical protein D1007_14876 [Hordeum vulgare]